MFSDTQFEVLVMSSQVLNIWHRFGTPARDEVTVVVIKTHLATLLQGGDMSHCVNQVITDIVTLHTLSGAGHGGITNQDKMSIRDREDEEYEEYSGAFHSDDDDQKKLSNKYSCRDKQ